jgi:DNA-binding helix-hairpin-helix protein with protein kinase domain
VAKPSAEGCVVVTGDGRWLELDSSIARGGEGAIHPVVGDPATLAKIASPNHRRTHQWVDKVRWMTRTPSPRGDGWTCAWPSDLLIDGENEVVGFLMPHIFDGITMRAATGAVGDPPVTRWSPAERMEIARRLATAVGDLHDLGHIVCDLSPDNVMVRPAGDIVLVDIDALSVLADPGPPAVRYPSRSWRAVYVAPEVMKERKELRRPDQDDYSLAVVLFTWLMAGQHPFQGRMPPGERAVNSTDAMRHGWFPHAAVPGSPLTPPAIGPRFATLPPAVQALFLQCFVTAHTDHTLRPTAREWQRALAGAI